MQDDNFEKQVAGKMEELRLPPSSKVWEGIEVQLKKDVYKKRLAFFMILLAGGIAAGILWSRSSFNEGAKVLTVNPSSSIKGAMPEKGANTTTARVGQLAGIAVNEKTTTIEKTKKNSSVAPVAELHNNVTVAGHKEYPQPENTIDLNDKNILYKQGNTSTNNRAPLTINHTTLPGNNFPGQLTATTVLNKNEQEENVTTTAAGIATETYSIIKLVEDNGHTPPTTLLAGNNTGNVNSIRPPELYVNAGTAKLPVQLRPEKKAWRLGLNVSGGVAVRREEVLSLKLSENKSLTYQDVLNVSPGNSSSQANYIGWGAQNRLSSQSAILPGASFSVNGFAERQLNKKIAVTAGLGYSYLSDRIKTGSMAQNNLSVVLDNNRVANFSNAFTAGENTAHTNSFHFIDLPVSLHWQLNNSRKLPLYLGLTSQVSYLAAVKALHYNSGYSGIYIEYDEAFNKWQHKMGAGIMAGFHWNKMQFKAGPQLLINTSKVLQKQFLPKQYFMNGGVTLQVYLK